MVKHSSPPSRRPRFRPATVAAAVASIASIASVALAGALAAAHAAGPADNLPAAAVANPPAPPSLILSQQRDLVCLAMNIYHEGRGESARGQAAIAAVTMNRLRSSRYPNTVCEVVWQPKQFSWTRVAARHHIIDDAQAWARALNIAGLFLGGAQLALVSEATHYHTVDVRPFWSKNIPALALIGKHVFYAL